MSTSASLEVIGPVSDDTANVRSSDNHHNKNHHKSSKCPPLLSRLSSAWSCFCCSFSSSSSSSSSSVESVATRKRNKCLDTASYYQRKFRDVTPMSSVELLQRLAKQQQQMQERKERAAIDQKQQQQNYDAGMNQEECKMEEEEEKVRPIIVVDVRTKPERSVSIIPGSISLRAFEREVMPSITRRKYQANHGHSSNAAAAAAASAVGSVNAGRKIDDCSVVDHPHHPLPVVPNNKNFDVVTYCTIGYRSGLEARRLRQKYRRALSSTRNGDGHRRCRNAEFYNLDGIVAYTHAIAGASSLDVVQSKEEGKRDARTAPSEARGMVDKNSTAIRARNEENEGDTADAVVAVGSATRSNRRTRITGSKKRDYADEQKKDDRDDNDENNKKDKRSSVCFGVSSSFSSSSSLSLQSGPGASPPPPPTTTTSSSSWTSPQSLLPINPQTGEATNAIHAFGPTWSLLVDREKFDVTRFAFPVFVARTVQVGCATAVRVFQSWGYHLASGKNALFRGCGCRDDDDDVDGRRRR